MFLAGTGAGADKSVIRPLSRRTFLAAGLGASAAAFASWTTRPDAVLYNGKILTLSARQREVEALALSGSRVFAIGTSSEMLALIGSEARRFDLGGGALLRALTMHIRTLAIVGWHS